MQRISTSWRPSLAKACGFGLGATVVVLALSGWQIPRGTGIAGTDVILASQPTGELAVEPTGPFVTANDLGPGDQSTGGFGIANQTGRTLSVQVRALPDSSDLDKVLYVDVHADGRLLYHGRLGGLRRWTSNPLLLASGTKGSVSARVWIPASVKTGYQGQSATVPVELRARPIEAMNGNG